MKLTLKRIALRQTYTIGKLYIDDAYFCDTLEDTVRDTNKSGKFDNGEQKIKGKTAIPYGTYEITTNVVSWEKYNSWQINRFLENISCTNAENKRVEKYNYRNNLNYGKRRKNRRMEKKKILIRLNK